MNVLVTGAAGYIGSHAVKAVSAAGHRVVALDNLSRGHRAALPSDLPFVEADVRDTARVVSVLRSEHIDCVMHFAAFAYVGESVTDPAKYYRNNVIGTLSLMEAMRAAGVSRIVFSSTCATYGEPEEVPIRETQPQEPINPYGFTKLIIDPATDRILGVGIVGPNAGDLLAEGVLAIEMGATARDLGDTIHAHPTLSETVAFSAESFLGTATEIYRPRSAAKPAH